MWSVGLGTSRLVILPYILGLGLGRLVPRHIVPLDCSCSRGPLLCFSTVFARVAEIAFVAEG